MRQSELFTKTRREDPAEEESTNAKLLIRAGFIHKEMAGVYTYLPLGLRVLKKIEDIIREEVNSVGGQEMMMTTLQDPEIWKKTDRWGEDTLPWFTTELSAGGELGIANTHEEPLTNLLRHHIHSYKDIPAYPYQFQNKFRNELRAKSGIMRTREFIMKDMYSYSRTESDFKEFYEKCATAYMKIFDRLGLGDITYRTFASGGAFSKFSDEFQTVSEAGEDTIYLDRDKGIAVNKEVYTDDILKELGLEKEKLEEMSSIEVGNIFPLGTKYAEALGLRYRDKDGEERVPVMGCYGIGIGRAMGTVAEIMHDNKGLNWPSSIAPFKVHLVMLPGGEEESERLYSEMIEQGVEVLYDDRDEVSPGEKLNDSDLIGIPMRLVVSKKTVEQSSCEIKQRSGSDAELVPFESVIDRIK